MPLSFTFAFILNWHKNSTHGREFEVNTCLSGIPSNINIIIFSYHECISDRLKFSSKPTLQYYHTLQKSEVKSLQYRHHSNDI